MNESGATFERAQASITDIFNLLPHRYPFLLVDRLIDIDGDRSATGIKNVSINEPYFEGPLPESPVVPSMLLIEGMAQTAGALCMHNMAVKEPPLIYFMGIHKARLRGQVVPGDVIQYRVEKIQSRGRVWRYRGRAVVNDMLVAKAEFSAVIVGGTLSQRDPSANNVPSTR
jgi:3-hydroxyacyl-[acyl-carrier-protein] dehydratase